MQLPSIHPSSVHPSIHPSIQKYSLNAYYVPGNVSETGDPWWRQTQSLASGSLYCAGYLSVALLDTCLQESSQLSLLCAPISKCLRLPLGAPLNWCLMGVCRLNTRDPSSPSWDNSKVCVRYWLPEFPAMMKTQLPTLKLVDNTPDIGCLFTPSHFPTSPLPLALASSQRLLLGKHKLRCYWWVVVVRRKSILLA